MNSGSNSGNNGKRFRTSDQPNSYPARQMKYGDRQSYFDSLNQPKEDEAMRRFKNPLGYYDLTGPSGLILKPDPHKYPLWILPNNIILLEAFSPAYTLAVEFLISIADPKKRPALIHEYQMTPNSLYASVSLNYDAKLIKATLSRLAKNARIPAEVEAYIEEHTAYYGQAKSVLHDGRYFVECLNQNVFQKLCAIDVVRRNIKNEKDILVDADINAVNQEQTLDKFESVLYKPLEQVREYLEKVVNIEDEKETKKNTGKIYRFEIGNPAQYEAIKIACMSNKLPLKEEYDYTTPTAKNPDLGMKLKPRTKIRDYQAKALGKMFRNKRAQSGIIVLPCGAGKSLMGVCAAVNVNKRTICFCTSNFSVKQWAEEFRNFTDIKEERVIQFTSKKKKDEVLRLEKLLDTKPVVLITTYNMMFRDSKGKEDEDIDLMSESTRLKKKVKSLEWGLCVLDEVHVAPADKFKEAISVIKSHSKLGLTATLLREDNRIGNLEYLIGPKLHEENWKDLERKGYLARALCVEIRCEMPPVFRQKYQEYRDKRDLKSLKKVYEANAEKCKVLQHVIKYHDLRGDKILIFSQSLYILKKSHALLETPYVKMIDGKTSNEDRDSAFKLFRSDEKYNVLFISSVGDTSIDLPDANVLIEISAQYGSRRQTTQRLGRVLRPKDNNKDRFNAFFYSIVTQCPEDTHWATKRQTFLINQGYTFKILSNKSIDYNHYFAQRGQRLYMSTPAEQEAFLLDAISDKSD